MNNSIPVQQIVEAMKGLLESRRKGTVKRITFLKAWGRLRMLLTATKEYQSWRQQVKLRAGGACEECGEIGCHAHHKKPISRRLDLIFDLDNGEFLCFKCHNHQPGHNLRRGRRSRNAAGRTGPRSEHELPGNPPPAPDAYPLREAVRRAAPSKRIPSATARNRTKAVSGWLHTGNNS